MLPYQKQYIRNTSEIISIADERLEAAQDFESWFLGKKRSAERLEELRAENIDLLSRNLFPVLDSLYGADESTIRSLEEFGDVLMDWNTNLDCGVYVVIHDALLSLYRYHRDRDGMIRELYKLGMGLYYLRRSVEGVPGAESYRFMFNNELVFTEAGSYIRYFDEIDDEETRGYIIRALANISLCTKDHKKKIAASKRAMDIINDKHYRSQAPGLPWDVFLRRIHQQMSANRNELSAGDLTKDELALVLDSCYEVFRPEEEAENPSIRWLWPYYEMEYNCGYVDLDMTLNRIERLSDSMDYDRYDESGFYANIQLPIYYGLLLSEDEKQARDLHRISFYRSACEKMFKALFNCPEERMDDYFFYLVDLVVSDYYEIGGVPEYSELIPKLLKRFNSRLYIRSRRIGELNAVMARTICENEPGFFDDMDFIREIQDPEKKTEAVTKFARECGLFQDFGLIKMNVSRTMGTRNLFENEFEMYQIHTISGYEDLRKRRSTARFADIALGHHRWYDGNGGYPERYIRNDSDYRQMTDITAISTEMVENYDGDIDKLLDDIISRERKEFSPLVTAYLSDRELRNKLDRILTSDSKEYYWEVYQELIS